MSDQPENIMLVYLRRIDMKLDQIIGDVREPKGRVERGLDLTEATA